MTMIHTSLSASDQVQLMQLISKQQAGWSSDY